MQIMHPLKKSVLTLLTPLKKICGHADTLKRVLRHLRHLKKGMGRLGRP